MEPTREEVDDLFGLDFDWFAQDATGALGLFATTGYGEIPSAVIRQQHAHRALADTIPQPHLGHIEIWQDFARAGLFVFDWQHWDGPYRKQATPLSAMTSSLQDAILRIPNLPQLPIRFAEVSTVKIARFIPQ